MSVCSECFAPLHETGIGRPPKTCSSTCRSRRHRRERAAAAFLAGTRVVIAEQADEIRSLYRDAGLTPPI